MRCFWVGAVLLMGNLLFAGGSETQDVAEVVSFDSVALDGDFGNRKPGRWAESLVRYGGVGTMGTVRSSLRYLKTKQNDDGSWGRSKPAMTSLALLAFLGYGDSCTTPEFKDTVEAAIAFLLAAQQADGHFEGRDSHDYTQLIAAHALAEAYALTKNEKLKSAAIKAVVPIVKGQNPSGGFNYNLKPSSRNDTSYMAWCAQALKAAKRAGLSADIKGLDACINKAAAGFKNNYHDKVGIGSFGYAGPYGDRYTAAGVYSLQILGDSTSLECRGGVEGLSKLKFDWKNPGHTSFLYNMYYATQAKFNAGGAGWKVWNRDFSTALMNNQKIIPEELSGYTVLGSGREIGVWKSPSPREINGKNPIMDTILCTLMLEVYYRYIPVFDNGDTKNSGWL